MLGNRYATQCIAGVIQVWWPMVKMKNHINQEIQDPISGREQITDDMTQIL